MHVCKNELQEQLNTIIRSWTAQNVLPCFCLTETVCIRLASYQVLISVLYCTTIRGLFNNPVALVHTVYKKLQPYFGHLSCILFVCVHDM